ncbi:MAG: tetratricopeptide repeat protein [Syntrophaceae bacterium]|nr:tetratricopeptide repeat protein [Syntrophaceae bacterium]
MKYYIFFFLLFFIFFASIAPAVEITTLPDYSNSSTSIEDLERVAKEEYINTIINVYPDFEYLRDSGKVREWIRTKPKPLKFDLLRIYKEGSAQEVINMITLFKAEGCYKKALSLYQALPQKAIEYLSEAIKLKPDYTEAYDKRGAAYSNQGNYQLAINDFNEVIRLNPDDANAYNNRGVAYYKLGQYQRAIEDYDRIISGQTDDAVVYDNRGAAYDKLGQYQKAIEDYNKAISLKPDNAYAYSNRGVAYLSLGNGKLGCTDLQHACAFGKCEMLEAFKSKGYCH